MVRHSCLPAVGVSAGHREVVAGLGREGRREVVARRLGREGRRMVVARRLTGRRWWPPLWEPPGGARRATGGTRWTSRGRRAAGRQAGWGRR